MSILRQLSDASLIGRERLMRARDFYAPSKMPLSAEAAFARWTQRISVQSDIGTARDMAGLDEATLDQLETEFNRCQTRPRSAWSRSGLWVGGLLIAVACLGLVGGELAAMDRVASRALTWLGLTLLVVGSGCIAVTGLTAMSALHLDLNHGTAGLYVGRLDEQHPWLYNTLGLLRHEAAESYRQGVLRARGPLRGLDTIMMRELVAAHDALERVQPSRAVAERVQSVAAPVKPAAAERRLVQVGSGLQNVPSAASGRGSVQVEAA